ncbi:anaphase-promoting complex subunit 6-like isoform X2 [Mangifera indica]|uniref:anaphase-promoting complex subunit 6-like isoform X2 n=1 Tax=Mangifera indica TaxID=29780 RepID=UPI001CF9961E|nr:anaphase-promoting complex subunit 6-like isoform X2 [Mangifera indica]XP_044473851.1 anaphase-promoting complex subunit 6-like isoform X2 [Mangifera indica]
MLIFSHSRYHLPTLYIGMEHMRTHSFKLAEEAKITCPSDPLVYNELGVIAYDTKEMYHQAISWYKRALTLSNRSLNTYAGLAYTYHLQDNFAAAISYYHKALWLKPDDQFCTEMLSFGLVGEGCHGVGSKIKIC